MTDADMWDEDGDVELLPHLLLGAANWALGADPALIVELLLEQMDHCEMLRIVILMMSKIQDKY